MGLSQSFVQHTGLVITRAGGVAAHKQSIWLQWPWTTTVAGHAFMLAWLLSKNTHTEENCYFQIDGMMPKVKTTHVIIVKENIRKHTHITHTSVSKTPHSWSSLLPSNDIMGKLPTHTHACTHTHTNTPSKF